MTTDDDSELFAYAMKWSPLPFLIIAVGYYVTGRDWRPFLLIAACAVCLMPLWTLKRVDNKGP